MALAVAASVVTIPELDQPGPATPVKRFRTAVVLRKTTRWDWEKEKNPRKSDQELILYLKARGEDVDRIRTTDRKQKQIVDDITARLRKRGVEARSVSRHELASFLPRSDLVISAGGDGTFLTAAAAIQHKTPVIGINTDPIGSEGHLCVGGKNPPADLIERVVDGKCKWTERSRIRVTLLNRKHEAKNKCILALNEVFIGEDEAARVSTYDIAIDDSPSVKQKSSGLIVSTGSGSTSWYLGMNRIEEQSVSSILETMQSMGIDISGNKKQLSTEIAQRINEKIPFEPDQPNFAFSIREPIFNATFKRTPVRGFARKILLKSRCVKGFLVLDGSTKIPFNSGAQVLLEMHESDSLTTVELCNP